MAITRWNDPFRGLTTVHRELDDLFDNFLNQSSALATDLPPMDVYIEDGSQLVAQVHLPGFSPEDVEIRVRDNVLEIQGQRQENVEDEDKRRRSYVLRQSVESFFRQVVLPANADQKNVQADFEDGVLRVVVPFTEESRPQTVAITGGATTGRRSRDTGSRRNTSGKESQQEP